MANALLFKTDIDVLNHFNFFLNGIAGIDKHHRTHVHALIRSYSLNNIVGSYSSPGVIREIPQNFVNSATTRDPTYNTFYRNCARKLNVAQKTHVCNLIRKYMRLKHVQRLASGFMEQARRNGQDVSWDRKNMGVFTESYDLAMQEGEDYARNFEPELFAQVQGEDLDSDFEEDGVPYYGALKPDTATSSTIRSGFNRDHAHDSAAKRSKPNMFSGLTVQQKVTLGALKLEEYKQKRLMKEAAQAALLSGTPIVGSPLETALTQDLPSQDDSKNYEYPPYNWTLDDPDPEL